MKKLALFLLFIPVFSSLYSQDTTNANFMRIADILTNFERSSTFFSAITFLPRENTKGTPYLFEQWTTMALDSMGNKKVARSVIYQANFDQQKQQVIIRAGDTKGYAPDLKDVQAFHFKKGDTTYQYVNLQTDGKERYMQLLVTGDYTLLKDVSVELRRADYVNNGIIERGHNYDQYIKKNTYYLRGQTQTKKVALKEKDFLKALPAEQVKEASAWLKDNNGAFDEMTAIHLVSFLNEKKN